MCGILGYYSDSISDSKLNSALECIRHRGPDAMSTWNNNVMGLGHARLSIIDLSEAANQPMHNENHTIHLIANGEIYNYGELKNQLAQRGHTFISNSDSEVILHGYEEWGITRLLQKLNGMFAFAIADEINQQLTLARDRIGIKPLYYWHDHHDIAFASELPALKQLVPSNLEIDEFARDNYFTFAYIPGEMTIYQNCSKLLPGYCIIFKKDGLVKQSYWDVPKPNIKNGARLQTDDIQEQIEASISKRLISDRPIGTFLSGGIDSSLVTAIASKSIADLNTFSIGFEFDQYDESRSAKKIAKHLGTNHTELFCTEKDALEIVPSLPSIYGEPFADPSAIPTQMLCKLARDHVVVALSGDGGDELTLGYSRYQQSSKIKNLLSIPYRRSLGILTQKLSPGGGYLEKIGKSMLAESTAEGCLLASGIFHPLYFDTLRKSKFDLAKSYCQLLFNDVNSYPLDLAWAWVDLQHFMVEDILTKVDRASMSVALEVRVPLLDHTVVEAMMSLSKSEKIDQGNRGKLILRSILEKLLPIELWDRPKQGFSAAMDSWLRGPLNEMVHDYLSPSRLAKESIFDTDFIEKLIRDHEDGVKDNQYYLWTLLMWEMWLDNQSLS